MNTSTQSNQPEHSNHHVSDILSVFEHAALFIVALFAVACTTIVPPQAQAQVQGQVPTFEIHDPARTNPKISANGVESSLMSAGIDANNKTLTVNVGEKVLLKWSSVGATQVNGYYLGHSTYDWERQPYASNGVCPQNTRSNVLSVASGEYLLDTSTLAGCRVGYTILTTGTNGKISSVSVNVDVKDPKALTYADLAQPVFKINGVASQGITVKAGEKINIEWDTPNTKQGDRAIMRVVGYRTEYYRGPITGTECGSANNNDFSKMIDWSMSTIRGTKVIDTTGKDGCVMRYTLDVIPGSRPLDNFAKFPVSIRVEVRPAVDLPALVKTVQFTANGIGPKEGEKTATIDVVAGQDVKLEWSVKNATVIEGTYESAPRVFGTVCPGYNPATMKPVPTASSILSKANGQYFEKTAALNRCKMKYTITAKGIGEPVIKEIYVNVKDPSELVQQLPLNMIFKVNGVAVTPGTEARVTAGEPIKIEWSTANGATAQPGYTISAKYAGYGMDGVYRPIAADCTPRPPNPPNGLASRYIDFPYIKTLNGSVVLDSAPYIGCSLDFRVDITPASKLTSYFSPLVIRVYPPTSQSPAVDSFTVNGKDAYEAKVGERVTFKWKTTNATIAEAAYVGTPIDRSKPSSCVSYPSSALSKIGDNEVSQDITAGYLNCKYVYTIKAKNNSGEAPKSVTLTIPIPGATPAPVTPPVTPQTPPVTPPVTPPTPPANQSPTIDLRVNGSAQHMSAFVGESPRLTWSSANVSSVKMRLESSDPDGYSCGSADISISGTNGSYTVPALLPGYAQDICTITYKITGIGTNGVAVTSSVTIKVLPKVLGVFTDESNLALVPASIKNVFSLIFAQ